MEKLYWDEKIETMPLEKLRVLQAEKLRKIVAYAYDHSPFYRKLYDEHGIDPKTIQTPDDLQKLPLIGKKDLRKDLLEHPIYGSTTAVPNEKIVYIACSSGTTGMPLISPFTAEDFENIVDKSARFYYGHGIRNTDIHLHALNLSLFVASPATLSIQRIGASCLWGGILPMERNLNFLNSLRITSLQTTPSYAVHLAEYAKANGVDPVKDLYVRRLIVAGEPGGSIPEVRDKIEKLWGAKVFEVYGFSDIMGCLAASCQEQNGLHVVEDSVIVEVLDGKTGQPVEDGKSGELVFTALDKKARPMIRYASGDIGIVNRERCKCGRTHARITVLGRKDNMFIVSGVNVYPCEFEGAINRISGISSEFRVHVYQQNYTARYSIEVERAAGNDEDEMALRCRVAKQLKAAILVRPAKVIVRESGALTSDGQKARRFVCEK